MLPNGSGRFLPWDVVQTNGAFLRAPHARIQAVEKPAAPRLGTVQERTDLKQSEAAVHETKFNIPRDGTGPFGRFFAAERFVFLTTHTWSFCVNATAWM